MDFNQVIPLKKVLKKQLNGLNKINEDEFIITGVTGMVGSHLVDYLIKNTDWDIYGFIRWNDRLDNLEHHFDRINKKDRIFLIDGDLNDLPSVQNVIQESDEDYVFHLGSILS